MSSEDAAEWITVPARDSLSNGTVNSFSPTTTADNLPLKSSAIYGKTTSSAEANEPRPSSAVTNSTTAEDNLNAGVKQECTTTVGSPSVVRRLFEPSRDSYFSKNLADDQDDDNFSARLAAVPGFRAARQRARAYEKCNENLTKSGDIIEEDECGGAPRRVRFSEKSRNVIEEANRLLESIESRSKRTTKSYRIEDDENGSQYSSNASRLKARQYSEEPSGSEGAASGFMGKSASAYYLDDSSPEPPSSRYPLHTPRFPRIDFDDMLEEELADRKPAWKQVQENIRTSFQKPKRSVERHRELNVMQDANLNYAAARRRARRSQSPFSMHLDGESFLPRAASWMTSGAIQPRGLTASTSSAGSGAYCAPAVSSTSGLEADSQPSRPYSRYDRLVDDIETRLLKTSILPEHMKTVTKREFRRAPQLASGSAAESLQASDELGIPLPRPYYSRPDRRDPDYFDFDLQHSIDLYRKPDGVYIPRGPQPWENKLVREAMSKGDAPLSGYMFTRGQEPSTLNEGGQSGENNKAASSPPPPSLTQRDWRTTGTSYLSAALRTASFWEHRFASIGAQVRDSNPVSMESILRNKPIPSRFTEYRDPDFEDYEDPRETE